MTGAMGPGRQAGKPAAHLQKGDPPPSLPGSALEGAGKACPVPASSATPPVDPVADHDLAETEAELCAEDYTDPRQQAMAHNLAQREYDQQFLRLLAAADYTGPIWEYFANELAAYGIPVLMAWTRTRKIAKLCADKGRPIRATPVDWSADDRLGLTTLTVAKAINVFRDNVLRREAWDPRRGATVKTFFMGAVILQFPNYYNSWYDEQLRFLTRPGLRALEDDPALTAIQADQPGSDPARTSIDRIHLLQVLQDMPEELRIASLLMLDGRSLKDAATAIGKTEGALSEQLRRYRNGRGRKLR
jgi:DNA-directed RNA polymerase specialized sigma24 family protein